MASVKDNILELNGVIINLNKNLDENIKRLEAGAVAVSKYSKEFTNVPSGFQRNLQEIKKETDKVTISTENLAKSETRLIKTARELELASKRESDARNALNKQRDRELARLNAAQNLYNKVQQKMNQLSVEYKNLATRKELGLNLTSKEEQRYNSLQKRIETYDKVLKGVDASMGKYSRNVGNYAGSFNPLTNSIAQLTREMPAFTNSVQTGFMAISNNLPIFFDAMQGVINQNKQLQAQGQPTKSVLGQLATSLLSFQSLIGVGVTLLTIYGPTLFKAFTGGSEALDKHKENMLDVNSTYTEMAAKLSVVKEVLNDNKSTQLQYNEALRIAKENGISLNSIEQARIGNLELINKELDKTIEISIRKAQADRLIQLLAENEIELFKARIKAQNQLNSSWTRFLQNVRLGVTAMSAADLVLKSQAGNIDGLTDANTQLREELKKLLPYITEEGSKLRKQKKDRLDIIDYLANEFALRKAQLEQIISNNKKIADSEKQTFEDREKAREEMFKNMGKLAILERDEQLRLLENDYKKELDVIKKSNVSKSEKQKALFALEKQVYFDRKLIYLNFNNSYSKITEEYLKNIDKILQRDALLQENTNEVNRALRDRLKGFYDVMANFSTKETSKDFDLFEKAIDATIEESNIKRLELQRNYYLEQKQNFDKTKQNSQEYLDLIDKLEKSENDLQEATSKRTKSQFEDTKKIVKFLEDYEKSFSDAFISQSGFDKLFFLIENFDKLKESGTATALAISEAFQQAFNTISELSQARFEEELNRLDEQRDIAITNAGESATAKAEIDRIYNERKKRIQQQQAEQEKRLAIFNIVIDTAQAVIGALANPGGFAGIALAAVMTGLGAAQIALVSSQPVPQFWKGTDNAPEGMAWTQEKGAEIITDKKGNIKSFGSNKGAQLTYLNKGDKVYTAEKSKAYLNDILAQNGIMPMGSNIPSLNIVNNGISKEDLDNNFSKLANEIRRKENISINIDERGFRKSINGKESVNNRLTGKSRSV